MQTLDLCTDQTDDGISNNIGNGEKALYGENVVQLRKDILFLDDKFYSLIDVRHDALDEVKDTLCITVRDVENVLERNRHVDCRHSD
jgi:hypothetical protein